jgi:uncharacterized protein with HEPN domain
VSRSDHERIADIVAAADELKRLVAGGKARYDADRVLQLAAERLLEIIGEAASSISPQTTTRYPAVAWRDIARLRILLAHHYHRVDPDQVWSIAGHDVPTMIRQLYANPSSGGQQTDPMNER